MNTGSEKNMNSSAISINLRFSLELFENKFILESNKIALVVYLDNASKNIQSKNHKDQLSESEEKSLIEIGRTELSQEENPSFAKIIAVDYVCYYPQKLIIKLFRCKLLSNKLKTTDKYLIGKTSLSLGLAFTSGVYIDKLIKSNKVTAKITINCSSNVSDSTGLVSLQFIGRNLDNVDILDLSDPFFRIKKRVNYEWINIYCSEIIKNDLNPHWQSFCIEKDLLTTNAGEKLMFCVYDFNLNNEKLIGEFLLTYEELLSSKKKVWSLINQKKISSDKYTDSGRIVLTHFDENNKSFIDYVQSGLKLKTIFAFDFSTSTGLIIHPDSIHSRDIDCGNICFKPLKLAADFLSDHSRNQEIEAYGFGSTKSNLPAFQQKDPFRLNDPKVPIIGSEDLIANYVGSLSEIEQLEPTNLAPIIEIARVEAQKCQMDAQKYKKLNDYTLLIVFTDGKINDMDHTIEKIISASSLPLSIVIVGLGNLTNKDLAKMIRLDSDNLCLTQGKAQAHRDICNFVLYETEIGFTSGIMNEVPKQIREYELKHLQH